MGEETAGWAHAAREAAGAVEAAVRRRDLAPRVRERLEMVTGVALGQPLVEVVRWSGRGARTVERWLVAFAAGGIAALADAPRRGRPVRAHAAYLAALERAVETSPRLLGLRFDTWTRPRLSAYLAQTTGVRIAPGWVRALLARQRFRSGRPKHRPSTAQAHAGPPPRPRRPLRPAPSARKSSGRGGKRCGRPRAPPASTSCTTRMRLTWRPTRISAACGTVSGSSRRCRRRGATGGGEQPAAGSNRRLTCFGSAGSVEAFGRGRVEVLCAAQDSAAFVRYLEALEIRFLATGRKIFLVLDNGPCHTSTVSRAAMTARAAWLHVLWLAPYCPNLNPKEREWRYLKRDTRSHLARSPARCGTSWTSFSPASFASAVSGVPASTPCPSGSSTAT